ncbi:magnesium/cobalt transporter CorA [Candidatus Methylospira mobilis]|uniref:magnesium/cobalt transporter CorA n=1 Tax=Candidatus Methylospira mobilis TaxID=1808979 RepID=UPI0028EBD018|nr:magnesium/cobalt transporter CorA [Candidatus Methylospira mobilis]WNV03889.1 magnesium/cobalt transporter CorA [Candidatus Methylospira mobilis]
MGSIKKKTRDKPGSPVDDRVPNKLAIVSAHEAAGSAIGYETGAMASMVVNCRAYKKSNVACSIALDEISDVLLQEGSFVWLDLNEPDQELLKKMQEEFGLHDLAVEDAQMAQQRPKLEEYGDTLFVVLQTAELTQVGGEVVFGETHVFVGLQFLVTVTHGSTLNYEKIRTRCESAPQGFSRGPGFPLYVITDAIVDQYSPVLLDFQQRLEKLEADIFESRFNRKTLVKLYELKREMLLLQAAAVPLLDICSALTRFHSVMIPKDMRLYFRDIYDHVKRLNQSMESMREMLTAAMSVNLTLITVDQNEVVQRLAGWGAILAIPTMVFSLFGMNFRYMPELEWQYSYPVTLGFVCLSCVWLYHRLKKVGWL